MNSGLFIAFEGLDGTGKSTQLRLAVRYLRQCGHRVVVTREPGGTSTGERVRDLLLASKSSKIAPLAELALMYAARAQLLEEVVRPALARGEVLVSDRYNTASFAFQGYGRQLGTATVRAFDRVICGKIQPDLTIVLDLEPEQALARAQGRDTRRRSRHDRFERQSLAFHRRVRAGYLALARRSRGRIKVVRADRSIEDIHGKIRALIDHLLAGQSRKALDISKGTTRRRSPKGEGAGHTS